MPRVDPERREIRSKVVYAGPSGSGKRTNLRLLEDKITNTTRELVEARQLQSAQAEFLNVRLGAMRGYSTIFDVYTLPGQLIHGDLRDFVLHEARDLSTDGVIFVADSRQSRMMANCWSLEDLSQRLGEPVPTVMQYNKQDAAALASKAELRARLNSASWPELDAVAIQGTGVMESFQALIRAILKKI